MIINVSRCKTWRQCKHKALNVYHRHLEGKRSMNLVDGGAFHKGVAKGRASKDWVLAEGEALRLFAEDVAKSAIPTEQNYLIEQHEQLVKRMLHCFRDQYEHETYQILQPECEFDVALPNSHHNCIFLHWWDAEEQRPKYEPPTADKIMRGAVADPHTPQLIGGVFAMPHLQDGPDCTCYVPHRFTGRTDAIVSWNQNIWLDEYKTTSISGDPFWDQWFLDFQCTAYIYGIWKQLKIRPRGILLNAIFKPSEAQVTNWNSKRKSGPDKTEADYVRLDREAFLRTEEDLWRVERQLVQICYEWEREITDHSMPDRFSMTPSSHTCMSYNRKCDFYQACNEHDSEESLAVLAKREPDYVDQKLVQLAVK